MQPRHSYLVCATPRSGSTLFCEFLRNTDIAGRPEEYFEHLKETGLPRQPQEYFLERGEGALQPPADILDVLGHPSLRYDTERLASWQGKGYGDYLRQVLLAGTTANGVFGAKMMWGYFADFLEHLRQPPEARGLGDHELLARIFPDLRYIWVTRQDKLRQAVSLWKAIQTQSWRKDAHVQNGHTTEKKTPVFHFGAIRYLEQLMITHDNAWRRYFEQHDLQPLVVVYEDLAKEPEATLRGTLRYLEIPQPVHLAPAAPTMLRQADAQSEEWVQRYLQLKWAEEEGLARQTPNSAS